MDSKILDQQDAVGADAVLETRTGDGFQADQIFTIAGGHFVHDSFSAFIAPLLPILQERLATSYALTGGLAIFVQLPGLLNPFLGYLADKVSLRNFIIVAPGITATLMCSIGITSSYLALAMLLLLAGASMAAFHAPAPAMVGRLAGDRIGKGMSVFMASGELGRTIGPILAIAAVGWFGLEGMWRLAIFGWSISAILYLRLRQVSARPALSRVSVGSAVWDKGRHVFLVLLWLILARVFLHVSLTTYLPVFMSDVRQSTLWLAAISLTVLEGAGVLGALATGTLSDRVGRSRVLLFLLGLSPLLLIAFLYSPGWLTLPLLIALGLTVISPTPVIMAVVQEEFPEHRALANGIFLAMSFSVRALGTWAVGLMADTVGLSGAFLFSAFIGILALPAVNRLPGESQGIIVGGSGQAQ